MHASCESLQVTQPNQNHAITMRIDQNKKTSESMRSLTVVLGVPLMLEVVSATMYIFYQ